ncbi:MAG: pyruvoyl-dependent arginine decarboxylase [Actinomycetota bacterium]
MQRTINPVSDLTTLPEPSPTIEIVISRGQGTGGTTLSAFDAALAEAGIANLNLLCLSSVIPPRARVRRGSGAEALAAFPDVDWGDRLYCVLAESRADQPGQEAWAGIGWWQDDDGRGVFVEHHGHDEAEVTADVECSLRECVTRRGRQLDQGRWQMEVNGARCIDRPVCALVVATYETQGWRC